ncbi:MAG: hypothetical protein WCC90_23615, partial [Methylocella sp.]
MIIAAILALAVVAFAAGAYAYLVYSPKPQMPSLSSEVEHATMRVGDRERSYLAYVPARLPSGAALVIVLHGSGMDGAKMRAWTGYEFDQMADQQGFVVLYPDGYEHNWNDCRKSATFPAKVENIDDMCFIRALIGASAHAPASSLGRRGTTRLATRTRTVSPCWFNVVVRTLANPRSGCDVEGRTSSTSHSRQSVSPGRTGVGQRSTSIPVPTMPPLTRTLPTRSRIVIAAVCQP